MCVSIVIIILFSHRELHMKNSKRIYRERPHLYTLVRGAYVSLSHKFIYIYNTHTYYTERDIKTNDVFLASHTHSQTNIIGYILQNLLYFRLFRIGILWEKFLSCSHIRGGQVHASIDDTRLQQQHTAYISTSEGTLSGHIYKIHQNRYIDFL